MRIFTTAVWYDVILFVIPRWSDHDYYSIDICLGHVVVWTEYTAKLSVQKHCKVYDSIYSHIHKFVGFINMQQLQNNFCK